MRKIYSFAVAAVAMFAAMSCAKEIVQDNQQAVMPDNDALTFVAKVDGADDASETKSVLDGLKSYWNGEEKIWILDPRNEINDGVPFLNTGWKKGFTAVTEKSQTATFVEDDNTTSLSDKTLMAVYPAGPAGSACWEGGESSVTGMWLSNEQTAVAWSYDPNAHIAIAQTAAASNVLKFKNVSSLLKFQVAHNTKGEVKFISYKPAEGDAPRIAGNFSVNYNGGEPVVTPENDKMTFDAVALKGEFAVDNDYYMAILPANLAYGFAVQINGYTVKELKGDSLTDEKFASLLDRKRNMILNLGTVSLNFGVCGTHTDWNSDTPMSYDEASGLYVAQDVTFAEETNEFKIRPIGLWTTSVGTGGEIVLNAENDAYVGGENSTIAAGTYDIWFDAGQKIIYAMSDGKTPGDIEYTSVVYLKPNTNWNQGEARFAAYFYREGMQWVDMTDEDEDGIYECEVPEGTSRVIFCRMNPDVAENRWNEETDTEETKALWNQSADLKLPIDDTNCYTIAEDAWDKGEGSWSTLEDAKGTPEQPEVVEKEWGIVGLNDDWINNIEMTLVDGWYVAENVTIKTTDGFKFRVGTTWDEVVTYTASVIAADTEYKTIDGQGMDNEIKVAVSAIYSVYLSADAATMKIVKTADLPAVENWGVCGTFTGDWDIASTLPMTALGDGWYTLQNVEIYKDDQFKFVIDNTWSNSLGAEGAVLSAEVDTEYDLVKDGQNIVVNKNGKFTISLNPTEKKFKVVCVEEYTDLKVKITVKNERTSWSSVNMYMWIEDGSNKIEITSNPGPALSKDSSGNYYYELDGKYIGETVYFIFSNNGNDKTDSDSMLVSRSGGTITITTVPPAKFTMTLDTSTLTQYWGETAYLYVWTDGDVKPLGAWPGKKMTYDDSSKSFTCDIPAEYISTKLNFIVHNNSGWQTADKTMNPVKAEQTYKGNADLGLK